MATDKDREYLGEVGVRQASFIRAGRPPGTVNTRTGGDRDIRDKAGPASLAHGLALSVCPGTKPSGCPVPDIEAPRVRDGRPGDTDALNLRHIRPPPRPPFSSWPLCAQGRKTSAP